MQDRYRVRPGNIAGTRKGDREGTNVGMMKGFGRQEGGSLPRWGPGHRKGKGRYVWKLPKETLEGGTGTVNNGTTA